MIYKEEQGDLFAVKGYYFAHCISADFALGAGIAVDFSFRFNMRDKLIKGNPEYLKLYTKEQRKGDCILVDNVFNLITKARCFNKPTLESMELALLKMKEICEKENIVKIAMPRIGAGLDRLAWSDVSMLIHKVFEDTDMEIVVRYL